jgi:hypothetical protein
MCAVVEGRLGMWPNYEAFVTKEVRAKHHTCLALAYTALYRIVLYCWVLSVAVNSRLRNPRTVH